MSTVLSDNGAVPAAPDFSDLKRRLDGAFAAGRTRPLAWRREQLRALERMLSEREEEFLAALDADLAKPRMEGWLTEIAICQEDARYALKHLKRWTRARKVRTPAVAQPGKSWIQPEPLGVVLIIGAWNYPLQLVFSGLAAAIAAGNGAVLKPSELAPATSAAVAKWVPEYLDNDCFAVAEGAVPETTALLDLPWDHILYTGGGAVGRIVMTAAAKHLTPVTLELGGKSPCIVMPDANLRTVAQRLCWGKFMNAGQTCIAPDYVLTDADTEAKLVPLIRESLLEMYGEDPAQSDSYARIINSRHAERIAGLIDPDKVSIGGQVDIDGKYIAPTVMAGVSPDDPVMKEEIFGPVLPVVRMDSLEESIAFINQGDKPLAAYLFSMNKRNQEQFLTQVSCGSAGINDVVMFHAVPELPFGGVGQSGMGAYSGENGFRTFSHYKAVLKRSLWPEIKLRYAPYTDKAMRLIRKLN